MSPFYKDRSFSANVASMQFQMPTDMSTKPVLDYSYNPVLYDMHDQVSVTVINSTSTSQSNQGCEGLCINVKLT